jgi:hypothetical protein
MKTHICIKTAIPSTEFQDIIPLIKKGDCATLFKEHLDNKIESDIGYEFKEHVGYIYSSILFLPIPPQQEKTVYVAIPETITELIPELLLN